MLPVVLVDVLSTPEADLVREVVVLILTAIAGYLARRQQEIERERKRQRVTRASQSELGNRESGM